MKVGTLESVLVHHIQDNLTLVAKSSDCGSVVSVPIARSIGKAMLFPYNSSNAGF